MAQEPAVMPSLEPGEIQTLQDLIKGHIGITLNAHKLNHALTSAWPALARQGVRDVAWLIRLLSVRGGRVWSALIPHLTINETYFMRESAQLMDFIQLALPRLQQAAIARGALDLRILSAACSSGEEPYSLAILLSEARARARITAVDIDGAILARAAEAAYMPHSFRKGDPAWRDRHFDPAGPDAWRPKRPYRDAVEFLRVNLLQVESALAGRRFDAIFCRNVLIYFDRPTQLEVIHQLRRLLVPEGHLFLGHSEIFLDEGLGLEVFSTDASTMYIRREGL